MNKLCQLLLTYSIAGLASTPVIVAAQPVEEDPILLTEPREIKQSDLDALERLMSFSFEAELTPAQSKALLDAVTQHAGAEGMPIAMIAEAKSAWASVERLTGSSRDIHRLMMRDDFLRLGKSHADGPATPLIGELWDARSPVLVPGDPPLRRSSADAMIDLFEWLASEATGQAVELSEGERDNFRSLLAGQYGRSAPGDRMLLERMEHTLCVVQAQFERADLDSRTMFRLNLADMFGVPEPMLPAPFGGEVATWQHPDDLFALEFPADWSVRYGALSDKASAAGWMLADIAVFGDAPSEVLELAALPEAGAIVCTGVLPEEARRGRMTLHEATFAFAAELLAAFGEAVPVDDVSTSDRAVLTAWRQGVGGREYAVWVTAALLDDPEGAAVLTLTRGPVDQAESLAPAFSRIIHSLRPGATGADTFDDALDLPDPQALARSLLTAPLSRQMDFIEALGGEVR